MELDKFIRCNCGKKKKINWIDKADYQSGKITFCVGVSKCQKCFIQQQHYSGNIDDIQKFTTYMKNQLM